jgi:hypothetical protein
MQKRKKVTEAFFRNWHFLGKVDADGRTDDGQVSIRKAPLRKMTMCGWYKDTCHLIYMSLNNNKKVEMLSLYLFQI